MQHGEGKTHWESLSAGSPGAVTTRVLICCRHSSAKALLIGFGMTFFPVFDVPVFWPILLMYFLVLFFVTMKRQIKHMIKYRYVPFSFGKKVRSGGVQCPILASTSLEGTCKGGAASADACLPAACAELQQRGRQGT